MNFTAQRRPRPPENVVPLINVVFLLLIFFMLTGTLRPPEAAQQELPTTASESTTATERERPVLVLDAAGRVEHAGRILSQAELRDWSAAEGLEIRADRKVPARVLLPLLASLEQAGVPRVDLVTRRVR